MSVCAGLCLLWTCAGGTAAPHDRLLPHTSVWSQEIDARAIDAARPEVYRETLGVYPVGNGRCFTYAGLGLPQNTLFMLTGPRYQTEGNHNPGGGFGELALHLLDDGAPVSMPLQGCRTLLGAPVVLTSERGETFRLTVVTAAPPGVPAIVRWISVERLAGPARDAVLSIEFRGRPPSGGPDDFCFEYPHRNRVARMRPLVIGAEPVRHGDRLAFTVPARAGGAPHTVVLALVFSESVAEEQAVSERVRRDHDTYLDMTRDGWRRKLDRTVRVSSGDRRLDDLIEGLKVLLLVQQDAQGGVCPMVNFKGVWLRDSNGPLLGFLHSGLHDEARRLLTYYRQASALHRFTAREFPLDLDVAADPDLTPEQWAATDTDRCEVPSFVVLQHAWWLDATGDTRLIERHWHYVRRNAAHQVLIDGPHGPLQTFNGDETYLHGAYYSLFPARSGYPNALIRVESYSADSMFGYAAAQDAMARLARRLGRTEDAEHFRNEGARMRRSIEPGVK